MEFEETAAAWFPRGEKMIVTQAGGGYAGDEDKLTDNGIKEGDILTIHHGKVYSSSSDVWFDEFPNVRFNSVHFELLEESIEREAKKVQNAADKLEEQKFLDTIGEMLTLFDSIERNTNGNISAAISGHNSCVVLELQLKNYFNTKRLDL